MESIRKPFQGVLNIIRFNWHFYLLSAGLIIGLILFNSKITAPFHSYFLLIIIAICLTILISLFVSFYIYDLSNLYSLDWIKNDNAHLNIININAGFDETSSILKLKYPNSDLIVLDFYDPEKHTEVSIKRARKAYPPFAGTKKINTSKIDLPNSIADKIFLTLAAHEIRDNSERIIFFTEINRILKKEGEIIVTEHLRDLPNFLAYNIGFFHFLSKQTWMETFKQSNLRIITEQNITPFISSFILVKNGTTN